MLPVWAQNANSVVVTWAAESVSGPSVTDSGGRMGTMSAACTRTGEAVHRDRAERETRRPDVGRDVQGAQRRQGPAETMPGDVERLGHGGQCFRVLEPLGVGSGASSLGVFVGEPADNPDRSRGLGPARWEHARVSRASSLSGSLFGLGRRVRAMSLPKNALLLAGTFAGLALSSGCASDDADAELSLSFRSPNGKVKTSGHSGGRDWLWVPGDSAANGPVSLGTEHRFAGIVRRLRNEGLVALPDCAGLPDQIGEEGSDPIPNGWFQGMSGGPSEGYVIKVAYDGECEPGVAPFEPGNVDPHPDDEPVPFDATQCEEGENEVGAQSLICDRLDVVDPMSDPRLIYPAVHEDLVGIYEIDVEQDCQGQLCELIHISIEPVDPRPEDAVIPVEADCEMIPELCDLEVEILDRTDLLIDENNNTSSSESPKGDECEDIIHQYNTGETGCTAAVAECAQDGNCRTDSDDGYQECTDDGNGAECVDCDGKGKAQGGACESYTVDVDNSPDEHVPHGKGHFLDDKEADKAFERAQKADSSYAQTNCTQTNDGYGSGARRFYEYTCK